jgi:aryl-alcohol dehydrogenase-like predicted oxidoreductase
MLTLPGMGPVIPGVTSVAQLEANAQAAHIALDDAQRAAVRAALA